MNEFLKAIGILAETSLNFYRNLIDAGATPEGSNDPDPSLYRCQYLRTASKRGSRRA
jgi:hypothetical protein